MLVVVGGQGRGAGKTAVIAGLIRAMPEVGWTAVKISVHEQGAASGAGFELAQQASPDETDAGRYLAAGAQRAYWLRAAAEKLGEAVSRLRPLLEGGDAAIVESNRVLEFLEPDLYLAVLDESLGEAKPSCLRFLPRADAVVLVERGEGAAAGGRLVPDGIRRFGVRPPEYASGALVEFVRAHVARRREGAWCR